MEDEKIVALLWQRDEAGLRAAEERHGAYCRAIAQNLLGSREDAEECWSDALLRAWNAIPPERPAHFRAYLAKLTRRIAIDRVRMETAGKRGGGEAPLLLDELADCVSGLEDAESEAAYRELGAAISRFLAALPAKRRQLFIRRYFCGDAVGALAKRHSMRENTVSAELKRTRAALRAYLEKEGFSL